MKIRLSLIYAVASSLVLVNSVSSHAEVKDAYSPNAQFNLSDLQSGDKSDRIGFTVSGESVTTTTTKLSVQPPGVAEGETRGNWADCESTQDPTCDFANAGYNGEKGKVGIMGWIVLPVCPDATSMNCIQSFEISNQGNEFESANFLKYIDGPITPPDTSKKYLGGGSVGLWSDSGLTGSQNQQYMVLLGYGTGYNPATKVFDLSELNLVVRPYRVQTGNFRAPYFDKDDKGQKYIVSSTPANGAEIWFDTGKAGLLVDFPENVKFRIKARVTNTIAGWFKGRIKNPTVSIESFNSTNNLLSVEGEPVKVPTFLHIKERKSLTKKEYQWMQNNGGTGTITNATSYQMDIFEYLEHFRPLVNDTASGVNTFWSLNSTSWGNDSPCLTDSKRVIGVVSTNAMGYNGFSPRYEDGTLNYQVAGMHYMPDGVTLVEGTYDLLMRSDAARCLYGFSEAPVQATISITGEQSQKLAVTSMTEGNGWIKLSAYGFNFSTPTIKVKLTQAKAASPVVAQKKKSITCVKGKTVKKVAGVNPKCPTGFKKR